MSGIVESGTPQKGMGEIIPEVAKLGAGADRASVIAVIMTACLCRA